MKKKIVAIIPARMAASRFPGKPLVPILKLPMIEHVRRRVSLSSIVREVYVATCDQEIFDVVTSYKGKAVMTSKDHKRCTDRVEEAARNISADIIVIVQGDEPLFLPNVIEDLVKPMLIDDSVYCTNLLSLIHDRKDLCNVDIVKTLINKNNNIMYFSRAQIPYYRGANNAAVYRQTGISAFTYTFLSQFTDLKRTPLEIAESIDFLRILENGYVIRGVTIQQTTCGVDREKDVAVIEHIINSDKIQKDFYNTILKL